MPAPAVTPCQIRTLSEQFDQLVVLPPEQREGPLGELERTDPALAQALRGLLAADDCNAAEEALPSLGRALRLMRPWNA